MMDYKLGVDLETLRRFRGHMAELDRMLDPRHGTLLCPGHDIPDLIINHVEAMHRKARELAFMETTLTECLKKVDAKTMYKGIPPMMSDERDKDIKEALKEELERDKT